MLSDALAVTFTMSTTCALFVGEVIATVGPDVSGAATVTFLAADVVELSGSIASASGQDVSTVCGCRGVPRDRVRRRGVLGPEVVAIEEELHTDNANVVRCVGCDIDRARDCRAVGGSCQ